MTHALPIATWRAQFTPSDGATEGFRFEDAARIADYLHALGISDLYSSPILEARAGSTHGYDVTDPTRIRAELGGSEAFFDLAHRMRQHGLGIILDIVPNHMAADSGNPWWWDVLTHGPSSRYARHFDIDWRAADGKVILPVLGKPLDEALADNEITIAPRSGDDTAPAIHYYDKRFPIAPGSLAAPDTPLDKAELRNLLDCQHYRLTFWRDGLRIINYRRFFDIADLISVRVEDPQVLEDGHRLIFDLLDEHHIRGLRIDHIDGLLHPRQYLERIRSATHHATGSPPALRRQPVQPALASPTECPPSKPVPQRQPIPYLIVEKILAHDEPLPRDWPIDGATGYEFLAHINPLFVDPAGAGLIEADAHQRLSAPPAFAAAARESKRVVIRQLFQAETQRLAETLHELARAAGESLHPDHLRDALIETTAAMQVYRTYITDDQITPEDRRRLTEALDTADAYAHESSAHWKPELAFLRDILLNPDPLRSTFISRWQQFSGPAMAKGVEDTALYRRITLASLNDVGCDPDDLPIDPVAAFHEFCIDRQNRSPGSLNTTSTHDTKRGEDTRLRISALATFAPEYLAALDRWFDWHAPLRALLPQGPAPRPTDEVLIYQSLLGIWPPDDTGGDTDGDTGGDTGGAGVPPAGLAAPTTPPPHLAHRLSEYMIKAAREAKLRTNWHQPDEQYEEALRRFTTALITGPDGQRFREDSRNFRNRITLIGAVHSLSQVVIKCTAPGIPDFYRGTELWDLSLVDPDNRRPVDFELRRSLLAELRRTTGQGAEAHMKLLAALLEHDGPLGWRTGAIKMFTMMRTLGVRNQHPELFQRGPYVPLPLNGAQGPRLIAFARRLDERWVIALLPRLVAPSTTIPLAKAWEQTVADLPADAPHAWHNAMLPDDSKPVLATTTTGGTHLPVPEALRFFPVALLTGCATGSPPPTGNRIT